jgi:hypothetical protein
MDEVIYELDVYFSNTLANDLVLLQYPLKPAWRPYDTGLCQGVKYKQNAEVIEIDYSMNPDELLGEGKSEMIEGEEELEYHTIRSSRIPLQTNYAVGVHRGNGIHLSALPKVYQMRPDFTHINVQAEERRKRMNDREKDSKAEEEVVLTAVPVRITQESDRARYIRERSWEHLKKHEELEKWVYLRYCEKEDEASELKFESLVTPGENAVNPGSNPLQYLNLLAESYVAPILNVSPDVGVIQHTPIKIDTYADTPLSEHEKELLEFLAKQFVRYGVVSVPALRQKLLRAHKAKEFKHLTLSHCKDVQLLDESLLKIADKMHSKYYMRNGTVPEDFAKYRAVVIELFRKENKLTLSTKEITTAVKKETGKVINDVVCQKILREFAYFRNGNWVFKSGNLTDDDDVNKGQVNDANSTTVSNTSNTSNTTTTTSTITTTGTTPTAVNKNSNTPIEIDDDMEVEASAKPTTKRGK